MPRARGRTRARARELARVALKTPPLRRAHEIAVESKVVIKLELDLSHEKARLRPGDPRPELEVVPFDYSSAARLIEMLRHVDPIRVATIERRRMLGSRGFVAFDKGEAAGYVFYVEGSRGRHAHPDLDWLGLELGPGDLYGFDYYLRPSSRGFGTLFARSTQDAQHRLGYRRLFGQVYASNFPALWTYRTTGWRELGKLTEHRLLGRLTAVNGVLYRVTPEGRARVGRVPGLELLDELQR